MNKLELMWVGKYDKENQIRPEPRILIENSEYSYTAAPKAEEQMILDTSTSSQNGSKCYNDNMLIHGDNLLALKSLEQDYAGKIKCIYIDPPYNTGSAFEHYDDNLEHSTWLSLMKPRLELLRNLLAEDGSIWITLDDNEGFHFKLLADEVYGKSNFISTIVWNSRKSKQNDTLISLSHNYIFVYAKNKDKVCVNRMPIDDTKFSNPDNDPRGAWVADPFDAPQIRANLEYPIVNPNTGETYLPPRGRHWRTTQEEYYKLLNDNRIVFGKTGNSKPQQKRFLYEAQSKGVVSGTWWDDVGTATEATKEIQKLFIKGNLFATPKPERLIERVLTLATNPGDLVLDSFLGSGTTAAVAHKMGRRWIGIELGEHAYTHCYPRMKAVCDGEQGGISKTVKWKGGGGFKFYELAPSLLQKDKFGNYVISDAYNAEMLAAAMARQEGYTYAPDEYSVWKQGYSGEKNYIFTTTAAVTPEYLDYIASELGGDEYLLICAESYSNGCENRYPNITIKPIPQTILKRCEYGRDNYDLNVAEQKIDSWEDEEDV